MSWGRKALLLSVLSVLSASAQAQTSPGFTAGQTLGATQLNNAFIAKQDYPGPVLLAKAYGVTANGSTPDDTAMAAALAACTNGATVILPQGIILMATASLSFGSNCRVQGAGQGSTTILRGPSNTSTTLAVLAGSHNVAIEAVTFDCNRANNATASVCMRWTGAWYDNHLRNMRITGSKGAGTGIGLEMQSGGADAANTTRSSMEGVSADHNDYNGVELRGDDGFDVIGGYYCYNGVAGNNGGGFGIDNGSPANPTVKNVNFNGGKYCNNISSGVGGTTYLFPAGEFVTINGVEAYSNGTYGIVVQGRHWVVSNNNVHDNGIGSVTFGGILANSDQTTITGNIIYHNDFYGIDAGGCSQCFVANNYIDASGDVAQTGGQSIWLGAATDTVVANNRIRLDPAFPASKGISSDKYEPNFPILGTGIVVKNNQVIMTTTSQWGITFFSDAEGSVYDNEVILPAGSPFAYVQAFGLTSNHVTTNGNKILDPAGTAWVTVNSGSTAVIPDGGVNFNVIGTSAIQTLYTRALNGERNTVIGALMTSFGSGYTSGSLTVTFGACGGGTPTGTGNPAFSFLNFPVGNTGVASISMTGGGANCNPASPPSCAVSGGGVSGVTCQSMVFVSNIAHRVVRLWLSAGATIVSGGNILLSNGQSSTTGNSNSMVELMGDDAGNWHQIGSDSPLATTSIGASGINKGVVITQTSSGAGPANADLNLNSISVTDNVAATNNINNNLVYLRATGTLGTASSAVTGGRIAVMGDITLSSASNASNTTNTYTGVTGQVVATVNDGGTNLAAGAKGGLFGIVPAALLLGTATNYIGVNGLEVLIAVGSTASAKYKFGVNVVPAAVDLTHANNYEAAYGISANVGAIGLTWGMLFHDANGQYGISSTGILIGSITASVAKGVDFTAVTFSSSAFASPGFAVDGSGNINAPKLGTTGASVVLGTGSALATTATTGFVKVPTTAGLPTGVCGAAGQACLVVDTTNKKICYNASGGGTWECSAAFTP